MRMPHRQKCAGHWVKPDAEAGLPHPGMAFAILSAREEKLLYSLSGKKFNQADARMRTGGIGWYFI